MAIASLVYLMPLLAFFFVFIVSYALFSKTKILGRSYVINVLTSFLIAVIFFMSPAATKFTVTTVPWIAILIFVLMFILLILTFVHGDIEDIVKSSWVSIVLVIAVMLIFIASAANVFGPLISLLASGGTDEVTGAAALLTTPAVTGALILLIIAGITTWVLVKAKE